MLVGTLRKDARTFPRRRRMPFHSGSSTSSKDSMPYGAAASARAATVSAVMVFTCTAAAQGDDHLATECGPTKKPASEIKVEGVQSAAVYGLVR